ncbi:unnamed protein product [Ectocarpus sp. 13 AM-2016]
MLLTCLLPTSGANAMNQRRKGRKQTKTEFVPSTKDRCHSLVVKSALHTKRQPKRTNKSWNQNERDSTGGSPNRWGRTTPNRPRSRRINGGKNTERTRRGCPSTYLRLSNLSSSMNLAANGTRMAGQSFFSSAFDASCSAVFSAISMWK